MAVVVTQDLISEDLWTLPEAKVDIHQLQVKDFTKWVRKQVRAYGCRAEIANIRFSAVEMWLQELGIEAGFVCGGEVELDGQVLFSDWQAIGYYMMDEEGMMVIEARHWLDICLLENQDDYLIGR